MALPATIVWEVRPATATSADNGGGFDSAKIGTGTDRSQQAGVQVNIDNAAITCTTPAANSNVLTFTAGYSPVAVDEGNTVAITGGTNINAGLYVINSVVVGTSWTLAGATNLTTAGGAGSNVVGKMGGARTGYTTGTTTLQTKVLAGHIVHIAKEAWNEAVALTVAGTAAGPIQHLGYNLVRGDNPTGANRPNNNRAGAASSPFTITASGNILRNLIGSNQAGATVSFDFNGAGATVVNCRATGGTGGGFRHFGVAATVLLISCEADNITGTGFDVSGLGRMICLGCYAHDNTSQGWVMAAGGMQCLILCISEANGGHGLQNSTNGAIVIILGGTFDGNTGAATDGINLAASIGTVAVLGAIVSNNGRDGIRATTGNNGWFDFCDFFGNVGAARTGGVPVGANDQALDPQFTNRAAGDFSIGTNLAGLGFLGAFPGGLSTGYMDIGAVQRQEPAAGGSAPYLMRG